MASDNEARWYAVRTAPGSQRPKREYITETTRSEKGYRLVPSLDPRQSAVERSLTIAGYTHYMPAEKRLVRDRLRPYLWKSRRFALMVGYIFVRIDGGKSPDDLLGIPGVAGLVRAADGTAMVIPFLDMMAVRAAEAAAEAEFDRQSRNARQVIRKAAKTDPSLQKIVDQLDIAGTITVPLDEAAKAA